MEAGAVSGTQGALAGCARVAEEKQSFAGDQSTWDSAFNASGDADELRRSLHASAVGGYKPQSQDNLGELDGLVHDIDEAIGDAGMPGGMGGSADVSKQNMQALASEIHRDKAHLDGLLSNHDNDGLAAFTSDHLYDEVTQLQDLCCQAASALPPVPNNC
jgi:hypothetical protein